MPQENNNLAPRERRSYFRIDDDVYIEHRVLDGRDTPVAEQPEAALPVRLKLVNDLGGVSRQIQMLLPKLREVDPEVLQALMLLNQKVDLLTSLVTSDETVSIKPNRRVSISGSGIAFRAAEPVAPGQMLEMKLVLFPSYTALVVRGTVVRCTHSPADSPELPYRLGVAFTFTRASDQDAIIRHTLDRQSARIREARAAKEDREQG